ncbi:hypothetical protein [Neobacillus niacini]|uniref:hypothetical protein n=1 Tax=Neobacillus niacini TaxID=86668 RepID=UPI0028558AAA|nr:hypothetical protein [Neobacillus niacini]MDR6997977.1 RNA polymerase-binding transcription factor DksA [Neobacillus niacini]
MFIRVSFKPTEDNKETLMKAEVTTMNAMQEKLFLELRQTKEEIEHSLKNKSKQEWITAILEDELADINLAMEKMRKGLYGQCEISGELLPDDLLQLIPTLKSTKDSECLAKFYKKPINSSF